MAAWAELASGATGVWRAEFGMDVLVEPGTVVSGIVGLLA